MLAEDTRTDVLRDECRLDKQCAGAAHKVVEIALSVPSCEQQHTGSQGFVERSLRLTYAVAAFVERLSATVQRQGNAPVGNMDVDIQVRVGQIDVRTLPFALGPIVGYGIFDAIGNVLGMAELLAIDGGVDGESSANVHPAAPVDLLGLLIYLIGIARLKRKNRHQDS